LSSHNEPQATETQRSGERRSRPPGRRCGERGQTTLDFAIGVSVFLAVLLFIFLFIPGILSPFTASAQDQTVTSNRVADQLATGMLGTPSDPYVLDSHCTVMFFDENATGCGFNGTSLESQVGVAKSYQRINVTIRGNLTVPGGQQERLCWDGDGPDTGLVNATVCDVTGGSDIALARGPSVPTSQPSVTSVRIVSLDGQDVALYVEMW